MKEADYLVELHTLALASRLRRLLNILHSDGERIYRSLNFEFKLKWFPVINLLSQRSPLTITDITSALKVEHPSIIQTVDELTTAGLIDSRKADHDRRFRELSLTAKGRRLCARLVPVWEAFRKAGDEVNKEGKNNFLRALDILEQSLERKSMYERIMGRLKADNKKNK